MHYFERIYLEIIAREKGLNDGRNDLVSSNGSNKTQEERCLGSADRGKCDCFRGISGIRWKTIFLPDWGGGWSWGRLKGGLISNTNRNKSPREFASILPFSSSNWQNRKIIPWVWSCLVEGEGESARRTWFFNGEGRRKYLEILLHFNPTRFVRWIISYDLRNLTKEI